MHIRDLLLLTWLLVLEGIVAWHFYKSKDCLPVPARDLAAVVAALAGPAHLVKKSAMKGIRKLPNNLLMVLTMAK